jgi:hypothetical protein
MLSSEGMLFRRRGSQDFFYAVDGDWYGWGEVFIRNPEYAFLHKQGWVSGFMPCISQYIRSNPLEFLLVTGFDFYNSLQEIWLPDEK